ncbi:MAG: hypothetical protein AAF092_05180 [Pseudomonadota bacterium]
MKETLEWAFSAEFAELDYTDGLSPRRAPLSAEARLLQQGNLGGVRIDTSPGRSAPSEDASLIADLVAHEFSDRRDLGILVASMARACTTPPDTTDLEPRCVPREWVHNRFGPRGKQAATNETYLHHTRQGARHMPVMWVPVTFENHPRKIAAMRRTYLNWYLALLGLRPLLQGLPLRWIIVTNKLPPRAPWAANGKHVDASFLAP